MNYKNILGIILAAIGTIILIRNAWQNSDNTTINFITSGIALILCIIGVLLIKRAKDE